MNYLLMLPFKVINMSWWKQSERHSQARKGIKTAQGKPKITNGVANDNVIKHKLSNNIHKNITALDRKLRKVANLDNPKQIQKHLEDAEKLYGQLGSKIDNHKQRYGNMPDWIQHDWVHNETFNKNGKIQKQIHKMKDIDPKHLKKEQRNMWNLIVLKTEKRR